jgi:hypothetical protein
MRDGTESFAPCARFRDYGMTADAPKSHCDSLMKGVTPPKTDRV